MARAPSAGIFALSAAIVALCAQAAAGHTWSPRAIAPEPRYQHAMAYHAGTQRMVLQGGTYDLASYYDFFTNSFTYDGHGWLATPYCPVPPRYAHSMVYDSRRDRVVLYSGFVPNPPSDEVWEYDGKSWVQGPSSPPAMPDRHDFGMAFDSARGVVVVFGGDSWQKWNDTWEYDGSSWVQGPAAPAGLTERSGLAMTYDAARGSTVLFGGLEQTFGAVPLKETWLYDGAAWAPGPPAPVGMAGRWQHAMAYDARRGRVVLFGGSPTRSLAPASTLSDTWEWDGSQWTAGAAAPPDLRGHAFPAMDFDSNRSRIVMFGGLERAGVPMNDTWEYDGAAWVPAEGAPAPSPMPRAHFGLVYDDALGRAVLFGGDTLEGSQADTWEYDGAGWIAGPAAPPGLVPRGRLAMAYDSGRARVVIHGGLDASGVKLGDTWEYDGGAWQPGAAAPAGLTPRSEHAMAYDPVRGRIVLHGGDDGAYTNDSWEYDGTSWTAGPPAGFGMRPRRGHAMAYHAARASIILVGGRNEYDYFGDVWELRGAIWSPGPSAPSLSPRDGPAMAWDAARGALVLFGGETCCPGDTRTLNDTWLLTNSWSQDPAAPAMDTRTRLGLFYEPASRRLICFGGERIDHPLGSLRYLPLSDVWEEGAKQDYLVGAGLGPTNPNRVAVFEETGIATAVDFLAYAAGKWGTNVAGGDVDSGATSEILTGPGPGDVFGPQVRGFRADGSSIAKINFYAYGTLKYGANVGATDMDADGFDEILTGPGPGAVFGPHVRGFDYDATAISALGKVSFFAYATLKYGVNVASGDVDADSFGEILTGAGPSPAFAPTVRGFNYDGATLTSIGKINWNAFATAAYGVNVAGGDVDADGGAEIACAPGPGSGAGFPSELRGFEPSGSALPDFGVTPFSTVYGGRVGLGDIAGDFRVELLAAAGRDPAADSTVKPFGYDARYLLPLVGRFLAFPGTTYGASATAEMLGQ